MFEHCMVKVDEGREGAVLEERGGDGWELVSAVPWSAPYARGFWLFFKRRKGKK